MQGGRTAPAEWTSAASNARYYEEIDIDVTMASFPTGSGAGGASSAGVSGSRSSSIAATRAAIAANTAAAAAGPSAIPPGLPPALRATRAAQVVEAMDGGFGLSDDDDDDDDM